MDIGIKIKKLRSERNMTLRELSEKSELSIGFLSQLERGLTNIAVDSLEKLSEIFQVPLTHFFNLPYKRKHEVLRSYEKEIFNVEEGGYIEYILSSNLDDKVFLPRLLEIFPAREEENISLYKHQGEEFMYVLEGILTLYINGERTDLYPGDTVHLNSGVTHNWINYSNKVVKLLMVNTPNYFSKERGLIK